MAAGAVLVVLAALLFIATRLESADSGMPVCPPPGMVGGGASDAGVPLLAAAGLAIIGVLLFMDGRPGVRSTTKASTPAQAQLRGSLPLLIAGCLVLCTASTVMLLSAQDRLVSSTVERQACRSA
jgi:hypothetical protein